MRSILNQDAHSGDQIDSEDVRSSSDKLLINQVAKGDEPALAALYQKHSGAIFNFLLRLVNERVIAEDLLQETFVAAWQGAARFQGRSSVKTWLFSIAHKQSVSWLRRNNRKKLRSQGIEREPVSDAESFAIAEWKREQVHIALGGLSTVHRAVVELAFAQGLSYAEIAEVMNCPLGTVKSRMSYAMRHLQQLLKRQDVDG